MGWVDAAIGSLGLIIVALIQRSRKETKVLKRDTFEEHSYLVKRLELAAHTLGISIDRVERNLSRQIDGVEERVASVQERLDEHIRDHATGVLLEGRNK